MAYQLTINNYVSSDIWNVEGSTIIPAFTYSNNMPRPTLLNANQIPDSISKSIGLDLTLDLTGIGKGEFWPGGNTFSLNLTNGTNRLFVPAYVFSIYDGSTPCVLRIITENTVSALVGDSTSARNIKFIKEMVLEKFVTVVP